MIKIFGKFQFTIENEYGGEINLARLFSGFSGFLPFNGRLRFTQLHETVTSHNQLCSELLLRQNRFHLAFSSCLPISNTRYRKKNILHGHIKL